MKTKTIINQKQIDTDAHFKYRCPNCAYDFWISISEAKTKNFKIVCDCGTVFSPKRIKKIKVIFWEDETKEKKDKAPVIEEPKTTEISQQLLDKCTKTLITYGFTKEESDDLLRQAYSKNPIENSLDLIKQALKIIGEK